MTDLRQISQLIPGAGQTSGLTKVQRVGGGVVSFPDVLKARLERESGINFSAHAVERMRDRNIELESLQLNRLSGAVARADAKGARDSLILMDDTAYIVSVKNRTVVTVIPGANLKDNVFTNIDSTVIT